MTFFKRRRINKWIGFGLALGIVVITIFVSNQIVQQIKKEEENKVEIIVKALELQTSEENLSDKTRQLALRITEANETIPMILVDELGNFSSQKNLNHLQDRLEKDTVYFQATLQRMKANHDPILVSLPFGKQWIYFENSALLDKLQLYPMVLIFVLFLFALFSFWYFNTINHAQKGFLWAGMAKETAHQIGTPLSSLLGWIELLKLEPIEQTSVIEMEKDIQRLHQIAERFSKIGSQPTLIDCNLSEIVEATYLYLHTRISSHVHFQLQLPSKPLHTKASPELLSWVLENLVRNAVDAMQNRGKITLSLEEQKKSILIRVIDNGPGIPSRLQKRIFDPGYTTKKRGWGLGLSLAKRIIEEYHKGKITVFSSEKQKGSEFKIALKKV